MSVPKGSILGPTLFLVCMNDKPDLSKFHKLLFADDTQGLFAEKKLKSPCWCS